MHHLSMLRVLNAAIAGVVFLALSLSAAASEEGQAAADQVSETSYRSILGDDQGQAGILYAHDGYDRRYSVYHDLARNNISAMFSSYGLSVALDPFTYSGTTYYNVVATKTGTVYPDQEYIVGAHFDSVACPGADDNGSGVALILEAARILSQYPSDYTIRFIAFDREENGLIGSDAYATEHAGDDILGMISADMVAYDTGGNHARMYGQTASNPIKNALGSAIAMYGQGLSYTIYGGMDASDHAPFEWQGFEACVLIEDYTTNPHYHQLGDSVDTPGYINYPYAVKMTRAVVGYLVDQAVVHVPVFKLSFSYPDGYPTYVRPAGGTRMRVQVSGIGDAVPEAGTGVLHYNIAGGGWLSTPMTVVADNVYDAVFPAATCGQSVAYYISAQEAGGQTFTNPADAPSTTYTATAAYGQATVFTDDMEIDRGWTVGDTGDSATTGLWTRNVPQATEAQPGEDHTPPPGTTCWVTDYRAGSGQGDYDVDGGKTTVKSPTFDLSANPEAKISYWRWYSNATGADPGADTFRVDISNDGGSSWVNAETVGPTGPGTAGGWYYHEFRVANIVAPTSQTRLRFIAEDAASGSIIEAAIDDFAITELVCENPCPPADGDLDDSGATNGADIQLFINALLGIPTQADICNGDFSNDGYLDAADLPGMVEALLAA